MVWAKLLPVLPQIVPAGFNWSSLSHKSNSQVAGNFSHQQGDGTSFRLGAIGRTPLKSCETNLPAAAVSCSHVFVNWAISVNFWNWVDRSGTGANWLPPVAQNRAFRAFSYHTAVTRIDVTRLLFHGLLSHNCCHTDYVTQTMSRDF